MPLQLLNINNSGNIQLINQTDSGQIFGSTVAGQPNLGDPYTKINTIISYLRNYVTDFRNPQFYLYRLDGNAYQINDGGNDMFDGGNFTAPWLRAGTNYISSTSIPIPTALPYSSQSATITDTSYYYAAFGYTQSGGPLTTSPQSPIYHPITMIGARSGSGPVGWQKAGNIGADGGGSILTGSIYTGSTVNGFTVYSYFRQTYGESSDPNICDVYILLGHTNWNSNFGGTIAWSASLNRGNQGGALYITGSLVSNVLAITTLLSRTGSTPNGASLPISASDIRTVVDNFTLRIKEVLNF